MSNALKIAGVLGAAAAAPTDSDFEYVSLLLHGDGTNGAQNNTFIDGSSNNFTITRNGNATQGSLTPFGTKWSNYFDGTGDYLSVADNAALEFGSGEFCIEGWFYPTSFANSDVLVTKRASSAVSSGYLIYTKSDGGIVFCASSNGSGWFINNVGFGTATLNAWNHFAVYRVGNAWYGALNGTVTTLAASNSSAINDTANSLFIGGDSDTYYFNGYLSNIRLVKGSAVYTSSNFTPPTSPLTAITNTSLLTCQSNRFIDNSSNAFTITRNGDVAVSKESPFGADDGTGGSGYFDGSGDYLTVSSSTNLAIGTNDFTLELWAYITGAAQNQNLIDFRSGGTSAAPRIAIFSYGTIIDCGLSADSQLTATLPSRNAWVHIALTRSGSTARLFVNGVVASTITNSTNLTQNGVTLGTYASSISNYAGYMSSVRMVKGTALYTSNFTPPTSPLTAITNTSLLLNFTNAGITDSARKANLETVGNAQVSTSVVKYGTGSMAFDGTEDYLSTPTNTAFNFGTGDFTIEAWVYIAGNSALNGNSVRDACIVATSSGATQIGFALIISGDGTTTGTGLQLYQNRPSTTDLKVTGTISQSAWHHIAVSRSGTSLRFFLNGTQMGATQTNSSDWGTATYPLYVGSMRFSGYNHDLNGYIDDLRITKGVARYTADFTPPTAAFPDS